MDHLINSVGHDNQFVDSNTSSLILGEVTGTAYDGGKGEYLSNWREALVDNLRFYSHIKDNGAWTRNANEVRLNFDCSDFNDPVNINTYNQPIPAAYIVTGKQIGRAHV